MYLHGGWQIKIHVPAGGSETNLALAFLKRDSATINYACIHSTLSSSPVMPWATRQQFSCVVN
jgi:hypothetical protein